MGRMNRKLRTKMNRSVRSGPTATLTNNAIFPLLEVVQDKNARSLKCADVRSGPAATLPENASLPMMEESNASSWRNAIELKTPKSLLLTQLYLKLLRLINSH